MIIIGIDAGAKGGVAIYDEAKLDTELSIVLIIFLLCFYYD